MTSCDRPTNGLAIPLEHHNCYNKLCSNENHPEETRFQIYLLMHRLLRAVTGFTKCFSLSFRFPGLSFSISSSTLIHAFRLPVCINLLKLQITPHVLFLSLHLEYTARIIHLQLRRNCLAQIQFLPQNQEAKKEHQPKPC